MATTRWTNPSLPQTLQISVFLFYFRGVLLLLFALASPIGLAIGVGAIASGFGIANERKWGYVLGIVIAAIPLVLALGRPGDLFDLNVLIGLVFDIALFALLVHPQSRDYQKIYFR